MLLPGTTTILAGTHVIAVAAPSTAVVHPHTHRAVLIRSAEEAASRAGGGLPVSSAALCEEPLEASSSWPEGQFPADPADAGWDGQLDSLFPPPDPDLALGSRWLDSLAELEPPGMWDEDEEEDPFAFGALPM